MGQAIAAVRGALGSIDDDEKRKTSEQLAFLVKAANSKLDRYQNELEDMFTDPDSMSKKQIPGMRAMRWERGYRVGVKNNDQDTQSGLNDVIDGTFGVIESAVSGDGDKVLAGFKKIVGGAMKAILGNSEAGEQEEEKFFIFVRHNAIIRIDVKIWRYNFSNSAIMANQENVFCYVFCTSVVDSAELRYDEITYLLSEYSGDKSVEAYVTSLLEVWKIIHEMHSFLQQRSKPTESTSAKAAQLALPPPSSSLRKQITGGEETEDKPKEQEAALAPIDA